MNLQSLVLPDLGPERANTMNIEEEAKRKQKAKVAAQKAAGTKGPAEHHRAAKMANWTRKHGKNDAENPYSKHNYVPEPSASTLLQ